MSVIEYLHVVYACWVYLALNCLAYILIFYDAMLWCWSLLM